MNATADGTMNTSGGNNNGGSSTASDRRERKRAASEGPTGSTALLVRPKRRPGPLDPNRLASWKYAKKKQALISFFVLFLFQTSSTFPIHWIGRHWICGICRFLWWHSVGAGWAWNRRIEIGWNGRGGRGWISGTKSTGNNAWRRKSRPKVQSRNYWRLQKRRNNRLVFRHKFF